MASQDKRDGYDRQLSNTFRLKAGKGCVPDHFDTRKKTRIMRKNLDKIDTIFKRMATDDGCCKMAGNDAK